MPWLILAFASAVFLGFYDLAKKKSVQDNAVRPVLLLCGERDNAGDVRAFNRAWTAGEGIPLVWVPGAGHNANVDNPDFVNDQIARFLASL